MRNDSPSSEKSDHPDNRDDAKRSDSLKRQDRVGKFEAGGDDTKYRPVPEPAPARPRRPDRTARPQSKDIAAVVKGWDYEPGVINVRKIEGLDGTFKLQMRLDLGLLQMEMDGRPDGQRPHECESLLDYHQQMLQDHTERTGSDLGFLLTADQCQSLREEASMYYRRYLSLFVLGDFAAVVRDTARNLRVLEMCGKFAVDEQDRLVLEQYRPYIIMMRTRAQASLDVQARKLPQGLETVRLGLEEIREFFDRFGHEEAYAESTEVAALDKFAEEIRQMLACDPVGRLQVRLQRAIQAERYEEAARLRDEIRERQDHMA